MPGQSSTSNPKNMDPKKIEKKAVEQTAKSAIELAKPIAESQESLISARKIEGLEKYQEQIAKNHEKIKRTVKLMELAQKHPETTEKDKELVNLLPEESEEFKRWQKKFKENPAEFKKTLEQLQVIIKGIEEGDKGLSETAKKQKEEADKSWFQSIKDMIYSAGRSIKKALGAVWEKLKEFASTRRGKIILIGTAALLIIGALVGGYFWYMGPALKAGSDQMAKIGLGKGIETLKETSGSNWKFTSGFTETWGRMWKYLSPSPTPAPVPAPIPTS